MAEVKEISRILVVEKFNDKSSCLIKEKTKPLSLTQALEDARDIDTGEFDYRQVDITALTVNSFSEFIERFSPDIYQGYREDENGGYFVYSTDPDEIPGALPMKFDKTSFFKAAMDLYEKKGVSGDSNYEFDYSDFERYISPQNTMKEIKKKRRELEYTTLKMIEAAEQGNSVKCKSYKKKAKNIVNEVKETYSNNPTALLCLSIADLENKLSISPSGNGKDTPSLPPPTASYRLTYNEDGDIVKEKLNNTSPNSAGNNPAALLESKAAKQVALLMNKEIRTEGASGSEKYEQDLVISVYSGNTGIIAADDAEKRAAEVKRLQKQYELKKQFYKASQDSLLKSINKLIEKMLDVKVLFDNSGGKATAIISNCSAQDLVNSDTKDMFAKYMKNINTNIDAKIWFAVLPQIGDEELVNNEISGRVYTPEIKNAEEDEDADENEEIIIDVECDTDDNNDEQADDEINFWDDDEDETAASSQELTTMNTAKIMINIFADAKCTVFFGFKGCKKTGFSCMNKNRLDSYKKKLENINTPYAVFAYPNFTLMSGEQAGDIEVAQCEKIENPGFYLDAPYFAAGLTIRSLNTSELEKAGFKINKDLPKVCVRFDFEEPSNSEECRNKITTNMNCEEKLRYDTELMDDLAGNPFGFFFDPVNFYNGKSVNNTVVRYARNMDRKDNRIFATIVKDFIWTEMADGQPRISKKKFDEYKTRNKWKRDNIINFMNNPLRSGEDYFLVEIDGKLKVSVKFNGNDENNLIDEIEIDNEEE